MNIHTSADPAGVVHVSVDGEIDMATADDFQKALHDAIALPGTTAIVIDFEQVTFCDSSGIAVLDQAYGEAADNGIRLRVDNVRPVVRRVLELTGLLDALTDS